MSYPSVDQLRARIRVRRAVRAALGCDGTSARAQLIDADDRRELANAYGRESRARVTQRIERITWRPRSERQLVFKEVVPELDLEPLAHGEQLAALAAVLSRVEPAEARHESPVSITPASPRPADLGRGRQSEVSIGTAE